MVSEPHSELGSQIVLRGMFDQLSTIPLTQFFSHFIVHMNYLGECLSVDCVQWVQNWDPRLHPNRLPGDGDAAGTGPRFEKVAQLQATVNSIKSS